MTRALALVCRVRGHDFDGPEFRLNCLYFCRHCGAELLGRKLADLRQMDPIDDEQLQEIHQAALDDEERQSVSRFQGFITALKNSMTSLNKHAEEFAEAYWRYEYGTGPTLETAHNNDFKIQREERSDGLIYIKPVR